MEVARYSGQSAERLSALFDGLTHGRYCADWTLDPEAARRLEGDRFTAYLQANPDSSRVMLDGSEIRGAIGLRRSSWDSEFWGFPCAAIEHLYVAPGHAPDESRAVADRLATEADGWCAQEGIRFAFARVDAQNLPALHALESHGFRSIETTVTNTYDLRRLPPVPRADWTIREVRPGEADLLVGLTRDAFLTHRFYADDRFAPQRVDAMYEAWVRESLEDPAWTTIVLEEGGRVNGFFTYGLENLSAYFGLRFVKWRMAAVDVEARGRGHGPKLFRGAMDHVRSEAEVVDSGLSLRNVRSFNLHNQLGFRIVTFSTTLHKWYGAQPPGILRVVD